MRKLTLLSLGGLLVSAASLKAQDDVDAMDMGMEESAPLSISGSVDTYYRLNLTGNNATSAPGGRQSFPTSFNEDANSFSLGMVDLVMAHEGEKSGFVADIGFGPRQDASNGNAGTAALINQMYAYWNASDAVTVSLGQFYTFVGYEVIQPTGNFNYSTSYAFTNGPFYNTGVKVDVSLGDISFMVGAFNDTDASVDEESNKHFGAQIGYAPEDGPAFAFLNYLGGEADGVDNSGSFQQIIDLTAGVQATDALYIGLNAVLNTIGFSEGVLYTGDEDSDTWFAAGLYLQYGFSDMFALGFRGEFLQDSDSGRVLGITDNSGTEPEGFSAVSLTLSGNIFIGNLTVIPEFRMDFVGDEDNGVIFADTDGEPSTSLASFGVAAVYGF